MDEMLEALLEGLPLRASATRSPALGFAALARLLAPLNNGLRGVLRPGDSHSGTTRAGDRRE
jgi:hypothetical protein